MVKRQKDKQYLTATEHRNLSKRNKPNASSTTRQLPFHCCALTLTPFTTPVCTTHGIIFESSAIVPYLLKYKTDPVTGQPMTSKDLITLHMDRNDVVDDTSTQKDGGGEWQCPVLNKPFLNHTKICAIRQPKGDEAYVYSYEAVEELNLKAKNYTDLTTGDKFNKKKDILILQDSNNEELNRLRDIHNFKHTNQLRKERQEANKTSENVKLSITASRIMEKMKQKQQKLNEINNRTKKGSSSDAIANQTKIFTQDLTGVQMTSGKASGSFTSTAMTMSNANESREATSDEILEARCLAMRRLKKKGFVRLTTTEGVIDLELDCDIAPRTCINFIKLVEGGKYDGTKFHRSIKNFMIQGGKPVKSSEEENSIWGGAFQDEFDDRLKHAGPGILSMANAGPNTNKRQFYITFKSAPHLDRKHSVFGRVAKGMETLARMEDVPTDKKDKPLETIKIIDAQVFQNPVAEAEEKEKLRIQKQVEKRRKEKEERQATALGKSRGVSVTSKTSSTGSSSQNHSTLKVGRYLPKSKSGSKKKSESQTEGAILNDSKTIGTSRLPPPPKKTTYGDFSGW